MAVRIMSNTTHTLLLVDDEPFNLDILQEHLEDEGYAIVRAEDGQSALDIINSKQHEFSAILLDRMMPNMDGIEVLKQVKASKEFSRLPVIMQTAAASDSDIKEGIDAGAFYYLTKPFEPDLLLSIVKSAVMDIENFRSVLSSMEPMNNIRHLITDLTLSFKTIDEAHAAAGSIASLFPDPDRVLLGLSELAINAVEHGNLCITYEEKSELLKSNTWRNEIDKRLAHDDYKDKVASISFKRNGSEVQAIVLDQGNGFDWSAYVELKSDRIYDSHGRGIAMAGMISFDDMQYNDKGNEVVCIVKL
ncbi:MAG: response regulator [Gammaproteobacteria bacterium]|nr:response regulator [Gammaproteobacteria bacterium]